MGLLQALLDLIFPPRCIYCSGVLEDAKAHACQHCSEALPWIKEEQAVREEGAFRCLSAAWYEGDMRKAFLRFKFYKKQEYATPFAFPLSEAIARHFAGQYDVITWIPVSKKTLGERGYDQARLLAEAVAEQLFDPVMPVFAPPGNKAAQSSLTSKEARQQNIKGSFALSSTVTVAGNRILLIDDVITTGSTLEEACSALKEAGAASVLCATLCRTRLGSSSYDRLSKS